MSSSFNQYNFENWSKSLEKAKKFNAAGEVQLDTAVSEAMKKLSVYYNEMLKFSLSVSPLLYKVNTSTAFFR